MGPGYGQMLVHKRTYIGECQDEDKDNECRQHNGIGDEICDELIPGFGTDRLFANL